MCRYCRGSGADPWGCALCRSNGWKYQHDPSQQKSQGQSPLVRFSNRPAKALHCHRRRPPARVPWAEMNLLRQVNPSADQDNAGTSSCFQNVQTSHVKGAVGDAFGANITKTRNIREKTGVQSEAEGVIAHPTARANRTICSGFPGCCQKRFANPGISAAGSQMPLFGSLSTKKTLLGLECSKVMAMAPEINQFLSTPGLSKIGALYYSGCLKDSPRDGAGVGSASEFGP